MSTVIVALAVSAVCLTAAKLLADVLRHSRRKALEEKRDEIIQRLDKEIGEQPGNLALHLRLRIELERVRAALEKLQ